MKDWTGNSKTTYAVLGASNHSLEERAENDFYATPPEAIDYLLNDGGAILSHKVWECACGKGHLSKRLEELGYEVRSTDLVDRGYGRGGVNFLNVHEHWDFDIITNPPYKFAAQFVEHALDIVEPGSRIYMFLKLQFLEGKARRKLFERKELETVYVSSSRINCARNGEFDNSDGSAVAYCWFCWCKGFNGWPTIKWIN